MGNDSKICTKCKIEKPFSMFFKSKRFKFGLRLTCKECEKKYYQDNKECLKEYGREYSKKYCKTEKAKAKSKNDGAKRRSILKNSDVSSNDILVLQQKAKACYWCNASLKNKKVHIDHYIPLSKGGEHSLSNLVVSCHECNLNKNNKDPIVFANTIGKLL